MSQQSGRVLTVTLNAAVDVTYRVDGYTLGQVHLAQGMMRAAGGKGNNVARVLASLGHQVVATGFAGGHNGQVMAEDLRQRGVETAFVPIEGESRTCITVVDPVGRTDTHLREPGPSLTEADGDRLLDQFRRLVAGCEFAVISGSLPPGLPDDFYAELVSSAYRTAQVRCIVDAAGEALAGVLPAQPYMVKPNIEELSEWAGRPLKDEQAVEAAARQLLAAGPLVVAASMGPDGLLLVSPEGSWRAVPPAITAVNTVGSGDALVAGMAAGLLEGRGAVEILRMAVAAGTANALSHGVAEVDPLAMAQILRRVQVRQIA